MVEEAVQDSPGGRGVSQHLAPVFQGPVGGHDNRALLIAAYHNFQQVFRGRGRQPLHAQVLQHQQVYLAEVIDQFLAGAGGFGLGHVLGEVKGRAVEGGVTGLDGGHGEGSGDVAFACAGRAEKQDAAMLSHETGGGQVQDEALGTWGLKDQS